MLNKELFLGKIWHYIERYVIIFSLDLQRSFNSSTIGPNEIQKRSYPINKINIHVNPVKSKSRGGRKKFRLNLLKYKP
ncbi:hypothetical protein BpHYR1_033703 [Brachionus plicatilis]|uniref:Uncharacterized protein n=1 Tax=Brachionus plicatilis TaxID=10195 RepID=A0A3M7SK18_BRAPC|nr:hypothetical protein BpHYR1_033703 [Brachionus plicatilis]